MTLDELYARLNHILDTSIQNMAVDPHILWGDETDDTFSSMGPTAPVGSALMVPKAWKDEIDKLELGKPYIDLLHSPLLQTIGDGLPDDPRILTSSSIASIVPPSTSSSSSPRRSFNAVIEINRLIACAPTLEAILNQLKCLPEELDAPVTRSLYIETSDNYSRMKETLLQRLAQIEYFYQWLCEVNDPNTLILRKTILSPLITSYQIFQKMHFSSSYQHDIYVDFNHLFGLMLFKNTHINFFRNNASKNRSGKFSANASYYRFLAILLDDRLRTYIDADESSDSSAMISVFISDLLAFNPELVFIDHYIAIVYQTLSALLFINKTDFVVNNMTIIDNVMLLLAHVKIHYSEKIDKNKEKFDVIVQRLISFLGENLVISQRGSEFGPYSPIMLNMFVIAYHEFTKGDDKFIIIKEALYYKYCRSLYPENNKESTEYIFKLAFNSAVSKVRMLNTRIEGVDTVSGMVGFDMIYQMLTSHEKYIELVNLFFSKLGVDVSKMRKLTVTQPGVIQNPFLEYLRSIDIHRMSAENSMSILEKLHNAFNAIINDNNLESILNELCNRYESEDGSDEIAKKIKELRKALLSKKGLKTTPEDNIFLIELVLKGNITASDLVRFKHILAIVQPNIHHNMFVAMEQHDLLMDTDIQRALRATSELVVVALEKKDEMSAIASDVELNAIGMTLVQISRIFINIFVDKNKMPAELITYYQVYRAIDNLLRLRASFILLFTQLGLLITRSPEALRAHLMQAYQENKKGDLVDVTSLAGSFFDSMEREPINNLGILIQSICICCGINVSHDGAFIKKLKYTIYAIRRDIEDFKTKTTEEKREEISTYLNKLILNTSQKKLSTDEQEELLRYINHSLSHPRFANKFIELIESDAFISLSYIFDQIKQTVKDLGGFLSNDDSLSCIDLKESKPIEILLSLHVILSNIVSQMFIHIEALYERRSSHASAELERGANDASIQDYFKNELCKPMEDYIRNELSKQVEYYMRILMHELPESTDFSRLKPFVTPRLDKMSQQLPGLIAEFQTVSTESDDITVSSTANASVTDTASLSQPSFMAEAAPDTSTLLTTPVLSPPRVSVTVIPAGRYDAYLCILTKKIALKKLPADSSRPNVSQGAVTPLQSSADGPGPRLNEAGMSSSSSMLALPESVSDVSVTSTDSSTPVIPRAKAKPAMVVIAEITKDDSASWQALDEWLTTLYQLCRPETVQRIIEEQIQLHISYENRKRQGASPALPKKEYNISLMDSYIVKLQGFMEVVSQQDALYKPCNFLIGVLQTAVKNIRQAAYVGISSSDNGSLSSPSSTPSASPVKSASSGRGVAQQQTRGTASTSGTSFFSDFMGRLFGDTPSSSQPSSSTPTRSHSQSSVVSPRRGRGQE